MYLKKEKFDNVIKDNLPPKNLENLEPTKVNPEVWRKISHKSKSFDLKLQQVQSLILKSMIITTKNLDMLYQAKIKNTVDWKEIAKSSIKLCADTAMILGKVNYDLLSIRRMQIMPELNYGYRQLSFDQGDHAKLLFGDDLPKQIKEISETNKVGVVLSKRPYPPPSSTISVNPNQNKNQSFLYGGRRARGRYRYTPNRHQPYQKEQKLNWYQEGKNMK